MISLLLVCTDSPEMLSREAMRTNSFLSNSTTPHTQHLLWCKQTTNQYIYVAGNSNHSGEPLAPTSSEMVSLHSPNSGTASWASLPMQHHHQLQRASPPPLPLSSQLSPGGYNPSAGFMHSQPRGQPFYTWYWPSLHCFTAVLWTVNTSRQVLLERYFKRLYCTRS